MRTLSRAYHLPIPYYIYDYKIRYLYSKQWPVYIIIVKMRQHFVSGCKHKTKLNWFSSSWPILSSQLPAEPTCRFSRDRAHLENKKHPIKLWECPSKCQRGLAWEWTEQLVLQLFASHSEKVCQQTRDLSQCLQRSHAPIAASLPRKPKQYSQPMQKI